MNINNIQPVKLVLLLVLSLPGTAAFSQSLEATLGWANRTELSSAVSGIITRVDVVAGQKVKKGDLLTQLSQPLYQANYNKAKAMQTSDKEALAEAKRELDRALELYERTVLAEHELQVAKNNHKKALAIYRKSQAAFVKAKTDLGFSTINAPFDAVVVKVFRKKNEIVNARIEAPLMVVVAESGKMIARSAVSPDMLDNIKVGDAAKVEVKGKTYKGKITSIGLEFSKGTNQYPLEVEFETNTDQLRAGTKAIIYF